MLCIYLERPFPGIVRTSGSVVLCRIELSEIKFASFYVSAISDRFNTIYALILYTDCHMYFSFQIKEKKCFFGTFTN